VRDENTPDLPGDFFWVEESTELCGQWYINEAGEYTTCVLHKHPPQTGHCDGTDLCEDFYTEGDEIADMCRTFGLTDAHGLPTYEFFEHFEAI